MEWVKRRIFLFNQERPHHTELEHVLFFRLRGDGTMWYQVSRRSMAGMVHRIPGGWLHNAFQRFSTEETTVPKVSLEEFNQIVEREMKRLQGIEAEELWD